jgi:hypothetical protein
MLASSTVDRGFEPRSGQAKDYKFGMCYFSAKHAALRRKSKDWFGFIAESGAKHQKINQSIEASTLTITPPIRFQNYWKSYTSKNNKIK